MRETCTIRSIDQDREGFIGDQNTPQACVECLYKALRTGAFSRRVTDTSARAASELKEFYNDDRDPSDEEEWQSTSFSYERSSPVRVARIETGYDFYGESYIPASVHTVEDVTFECAIESQS